MRRWLGYRLAVWLARWRATGPAGEAIAAAWLQRRGLRVLRRNLKTPNGEIDLLAETADGRTLVIVEVKTARGEGPPPQMRVGLEKQRRLCRLGAELLRRQKRRRAMRFDVVAVRMKGRTDRQPEITHIPGAFESSV